MNTEKLIDDWRAQYQVRTETADMVRRELQGARFRRDIESIEKFIKALGPVLPNTRGLPEALRKGSDPDDDALAIADLASKLKTRLMLSGSLLMPMLLSEIEDRLGEKASEDFIDGLYLRLEILQAAANAHNAGFNGTETGRPGPKNEDAAWFVSIVARHWQAQMPNTQITPNGAFKRICKEIARLEGLPFKITRDAINDGLQIKKIVEIDN